MKSIYVVENERDREFVKRIFNKALMNKEGGKDYKDIDNIEVTK